MEASFSIIKTHTLAYETQKQTDRLTSKRIMMKIFHTSHITHLHRLSMPYLIICMTDDCRTPGTNIINIFIPIHIPHTRTLYRVKNYRLPTNRFEGTDRRINTSGHQLLRYSETSISKTSGTMGRNGDKLTEISNGERS